MDKVLYNVYVKLPEDREVLATQFWYEVPDLNVFGGDQRLLDQQAQRQFLSQKDSVLKVNGLVIVGGNSWNEADVKGYRIEFVQSVLKPVE